MKRILITLFLALSVSGYSEVVNWVIAKVGHYSITQYDVERMKDFLEMGGMEGVTAEDSFKSLIITYSLLTLGDKNEQINLQQDEINQYIESITNTTNSNDPGAEFRSKIFMEFPEEFKLHIEKEQIKQALIFFDEDLKGRLNKEIPEEEMEVFYEENKEMFMMPPAIDLMVFAAYSPDSGGLSDLENFENAFMELVTYLQNTDDADAVFRKFNGRIKFLSYSGRTGEKLAYELIEEGYPENILSIPFMEKVDFPGVSIPVTVGKVLSFPSDLAPNPIPLSETGKPTYLAMKIISRQMPETIPFEDARRIIETRLKQELNEVIIDDFILEKIIAGDVMINVKDNNFEGEYNEFLRR